ncbi:MAG TPA: phosphatidylserine decarboxylase [Bdellovibrionota bacterium]|nr:phosphatidylserine decarboxylase [Bdellovibrionota bacterium]
MKDIEYWDRREGKSAKEAIYGERFMRWIYETPPGRLMTRAFLSRRPFSKAYGLLQSAPWSRRKIRPFIQRFSIPMDEYVDDGFRSFNDFFIRKFRPGARPIERSPSRMPAFAEGKYVAYAESNVTDSYPLKGTQVPVSALLGERGEREGWTARLEGGPLMIARLCPTDYHRYHYPDDGRTLDSYTVHGPLHSVSPIALGQKEDILFTNERRVAILETACFGLLAYVEVGAICVGRIVQSHDEKRPFKRGDEKGYFLFGGSTVVLLGEAKKWRPDSDLIAKTGEGLETAVRLGEGVAARC